MSPNEEKNPLLVGIVTHYFPKVGVAAVKLLGKIKVGDKVRFVGSSTNFEDEITSIQIEHERVNEAEAPSEVGIKVKEKVKEKDRVYLI